MHGEKKNSVKIIKDEVFLHHLANIPHPECPERLKAIYESLSKLEHLIPLSYIKPRSATKDEVALIHNPSYIEEIENISQFPAYLDADTPITKYSYKAALFAAGGILEAVNAVILEKSPVFALIRPPGHHAESNMAKGFCLFNNVAIAARYAQKKHGINRILICDWDVHHGNGTQHAFYSDPSVLYFSIHQYPHYPGTGNLREIGIGKGEGYTINCPLPPGQGDTEYKAIFQHILTPIAITFHPELIIVSAGFDPYLYDPLAQMEITEEGFAFMTSTLMEIASSCNCGRIIFSLEGGYHLHGIGKCVSRVIRTLGGGEDTVLRQKISSETIRIGTRRFIEHATLQFSKYWQIL